MPIDLFSPQVAASAQHPLFQMMKGDHYNPERAVLPQWAEGFEDRDRKFVRDFKPPRIVILGAVPVCGSAGMGSTE